jgi:hypothetical protein
MNKKCTQKQNWFAKTLFFFKSLIRGEVERRHSRPSRSLMCCLYEECCSWWTFFFFFAFAFLYFGFPFLLFFLLPSLLARIALCTIVDFLSVE